MARTYKRDARGRFASGGGSSGGGRSNGKAAAKSKPAKRSAPKTTSARGRALQNQRRAAALVSASRGGRGPSARAIRSVLTAQRARAFYAATGGGKKRSAVKPAAKKSAKATAAAVRARTKAGSGGKAKGKAAKSGGGKVVLDEARWRRIAQRVKTRGEVRAYIEGKRMGGYNSSTEKRVFAAYATRQRAEQFLLGLTKNKADKSFRGSRVSGLAELNANFQSRKRGGTGSTSIGVAARNRIYDEERRAKRAANKEARAAGQTKPRKPRKRS